MATSADSPLVRQWILLREISSRRFGLTIKEMARDYDVSQRTIRRDLVTLQRVGFPLEERESDHGRKHWRLGATASGPPLGSELKLNRYLTFDDAVIVTRSVSEGLHEVFVTWSLAYASGYNESRIFPAMSSTKMPV